MGHRRTRRRVSHRRRLRAPPAEECSAEELAAAEEEKEVHAEDAHVLVASLGLASAAIEASLRALLVESEIRNLEAIGLVEEHERAKIGVRPVRWLEIAARRSSLPRSCARRRTRVGFALFKNAPPCYKASKAKRAKRKGSCGFPRVFACFASQNRQTPQRRRARGAALEHLD
jgi:hypothetical protein